MALNIDAAASRPVNLGRSVCGILPSAAAHGSLIFMPQLVYFNMIFRGE